MEEAVNHRPRTVEVLIQSQAHSCDICGEQSDNGTGFSPSTSTFRC
jgi:hypothetical protein